MSNHWWVYERLKIVARDFGAVRKTSFAWGNASWSFSPEVVELERRGGPNFSAVEPRPCRMMNVCLCSSIGGTITAGGNSPGRSFTVDRENRLPEVGSCWEAIFAAGILLVSLMFMFESTSAYEILTFRRGERIGKYWGFCERWCRCWWLLGFVSRWTVKAAVNK